MESAGWIMQSSARRTQEAAKGCKGSDTETVSVSICLEEVMFALTLGGSGTDLGDRWLHSSE